MSSAPQLQPCTIVIPSALAVLRRHAALGRGVCLAALFFLGTVSTAWATVSFAATAKVSAAAATTVTIPTFNPGGAANRVLVVGLSFGLTGAPTGVGVTYGGIALTLA